MKLRLEDIKKIAVGVVSVWQEEDVFCFAKCTDKQVKVWQTLGENLGPRSKTTTGVKLDFYTNSKKFVFEVNTGDRYEVYVDGLLNKFWNAGSVEEDLKGLVARVDLDGAKHRVTLVFPSHTVGTLKNIEIEDEALLSPYEYKCKMMFFGDSITQGWNSKWDSLSFAHIVSRHFDANSIIQGIGGAIFHEDTFDESIEFEPDVVCVAYGTNDWGYYATKDELRFHCAAYLDKIVERYGSKKMYAVSPIWRADTKEDRPMGSFEECCNIVKNEILKRNIILIDGYKMVPHCEEFFDDGFLHPDDLGFTIYAENLIKEMEKHGV